MAWGKSLNPHSERLTPVMNPTSHRALDRPFLVGQAVHLRCVVELRLGAEGSAWMALVAKASKPKGAGPKTSDCGDG